MARHAWVAFAGLGALAVAASTRMPDSAQLATLSLVQLAGGLSVLVGVRVHRPAHRLAWHLLAASGICYSLGVACWWVYAARLHLAVPYPGWPDVFLVPAVLLPVASLSTLLRRRNPGRDVPAMLDAAILAVGVGLANWLFLTGPAALGEGLTSGQRLANVAYPLVDVVVMALVARLLLGGGRLSPSLWLVTGGVLANLAGDTAYAVVSVEGGYHPGALPDLLWMLCQVLLAAAAIHPSMSTISEESHSQRQGLSTGRLTFMVVSLQVGPVVLLVKAMSGRSLPGIATALTTILLAGMIGARMAQLVASLRALSLRDPLTDLPNRALLGQHLELVLGRRDVGATPGALLFVDLDRFKAVNDDLGHRAGDQVLVDVAARLTRVVRPDDVVARLGGDEFVIVCAHIAAGDAERLAARVVAAMQEAFPLEGHGCEVGIGASVGLVALDPGTPGAAEVLRRGDAAMYAAKRAGRSGWMRFDGGGPGSAAGAPGAAAPSAA